jgi:7-cyano-7-deazaguanine synthase in queuosine biosynthesis
MSNKITDIPFVNALVNTANQKQIKQKQKGFLCMFSGGLDSTALLHALLTNKNYEHFNVYVHHIRLKNRENRGAAELNAVRNIVKYYHRREDIREFDYKESTFDTSTMDENWSPRYPFDIDVVCFMAAQVCLAKPQIKHVGLAVTKDDLDGPQDDSTLARIWEAPKIFDASLYLFPEQIPRPTFIYPTQKLTKQQLWNSLPKNIQQMTWSCRIPVWENGIPQKCGKCHTCKKRKEAGIDS